MTTKEAIHFAECLKNNWTINLDDLKDFCDMAIEALSKRDNAEEKRRKMSILIKDIDITALNDDSSIGYKDIRIFADGSATTSSGKYPYIKTFEWVEVPTPHGDLIDKEDLKLSIEHYHGRFRFVNESPVVIESEE